MSNDTKQGRRAALKRILKGGGIVAGSFTLPAIWVSPVVDRIILPAHAQMSPTVPPTTPVPVTMTVDFTCPQQGGFGDTPATYTGQLSGPSGFDFSGLSVTFDVDVEMGSQRVNRQFMVTPATDGSFSLIIDYSSNAMPFTGFAYPFVQATADITVRDASNNVLDSIIEMRNPYTGPGSSDPSRYCLVGRY